MPPKIAASVIAWHFSPRMHGVVAAQLTADYMIVPPSSVRRLQVCAALKSDLDEAVARFFGYSASGPMRASKASSESPKSGASPRSSFWLTRYRPRHSAGPTSRKPAASASK